MKRILITGASSYVGNHLARWLEREPGQYSTHAISLRDDSWRNMSFTEYDAVVHAAGIAHVTSSPEMKETYYCVNCDLAIETARKAKEDGVKQFIFLSSIKVYGDEVEVILKDTVPRPSDDYGNSKLMAEEGIRELEDARFKLAIIRPPMIYGPGSKGNYPKLVKLARTTPLYPSIRNRRSMLAIHNLCELIRLIIDYEDRGLFFPQNQESVVTSEMVKTIARLHNRRILFLPLFNPLIYWLMPRVDALHKLFGNLSYSEEMSEYRANYRVVSFEESLRNPDLQR